MLKLGVNVDHVATLREARKAVYPDPVEAALAAERGGAQAITVHLREDRRHIRDDDLIRLRERIHAHLNQEMAPTAEMMEIALELRPDEICLVPERREELTTEGGLDVAGLTDRLRPIIERLRLNRTSISLFIDPEPHQVEAAASLGADFVELHTGTYANLADVDLESGRAASAINRSGRVKNSAAAKGIDIRYSEATIAELAKIRGAVKLARERGVKSNVGHGLNYRNVGPIAAIPGLVWAHIGHSIVARSIIVGMERAVREMNAKLNPRAPTKK
jgi:pyridoxine 5-phosphate synthase